MSGLTRRPPPDSLANSFIRMKKTNTFIPQTLLSAITPKRALLLFD